MRNFLLLRRKKEVLEDDFTVKHNYKGYASFQRRLFAAAVDLFLAMVALWPFAQLIHVLIYAGVTPPDLFSKEIEIKGLSEDDQLALLGQYVLQPGIIIRYLLENTISMLVISLIVWLFWIYKSATPGKMLAFTKIIDATHGGKPTKKQFFIRLVGYSVSFSVLGIGFLALAFNKRRQSWHDRMANTVVVRYKGFHKIAREALPKGS